MVTRHLLESFPGDESAISRDCLQVPSDLDATIVKVAWVEGTHSSNRQINAAGAAAWASVGDDGGHGLALVVHLDSLAALGSNTAWVGG